MEAAFGRVGESVRIAFILAKHTVLSVGQNWSIALLSIVLASSLWVYVTNRQDKEQTGRIPGTVSVECVNVPAGEAESTPCSDQAVTVRVRAPLSVFNHLTSDDCRATADVAGVSGAGVSAPVNVVCDRAGVQVIDWSPSQIPITLENVASQNITPRAQVVGVPPQGFQVQQIAVQPNEVVVSGPQSLVNRVASVEADLDLTGVHANLDQTVLLKARDEQGGEVHGVNVDPKSAQVHVTMKQVQFSAVFVVKPDISGVPGAGFAVRALQIDPPFVTISGPAEVFQSLDPSRGVTTEPISIDGASSDVVRTVALQLPSGANVAQPGVTVHVVITPLNAPGPTP